MTIKFDKDEDRAIYVDAYDPKTNTIFEYNGCMYHECDCIYDDQDKKEIEYWDYHLQKYIKKQYNTELEKKSILNEIKQRNNSCCTLRNTKNKNYTVESVRMKDECKRNLLKKLGFNFVTIRECDVFRRWRKIDPILNYIIKETNMNKPTKENLTIRDSLHGGRTDLCNLFW